MDKIKSSQVCLEIPTTCFEHHYADHVVSCILCSSLRPLKLCYCLCLFTTPFFLNLITNQSRTSLKFRFLKVIPKNGVTQSVWFYWTWLTPKKWFPLKEKMQIKRRPVAPPIISSTEKLTTVIFERWNKEDGRKSRIIHSFLFFSSPKSQNSVAVKQNFQDFLFYLNSYFQTRLEWNFLAF